MQTICTSLQTDNHTNTSSLNVYRPDALPDANQQRQSTEHMVSAPTCWKTTNKFATVTAARSHIATRCHLLITLSILTAGMIKYVPTKMPLPTVESQSSNSRSLSPTKSTYKWHFHQFSHFAVLANVSNIGRNSLHLTLHTRCGLTTHTSAILQTDLGYLLSRFSFTTNSLS